MISKWYDKKADAIKLRQNGVSIRTIEKSLGVPKSTLSGWFKEISLDATQKAKLADKQLEVLARARNQAASWHNEQKLARMRQAETEARGVLDQIKLDPPVTELALAMFYQGSGKTGEGTTSFSSSNPVILRFILAALETSYSLNRKQLYYGLRLRADQGTREQGQYWAQQLGAPLENFKNISHDKRTVGKPSFSSYHGVCVIDCGITIQRRLIYLYNLFSQEVINKAGV